MKGINATLTVVGFIILIGLLSMVFTISQGYNGMLLRLGRLVMDKQTDKPLVLKPGLHFKWPFIESSRIFDIRLQTLDIKSSRIVTKEKKDVIADYYVKWKIEDLARYYRATGGISFKAEALLEQQINTRLRAEFGKRTIAQVVSDSRDEIMHALKDKAEEQAESLGIEVVDVRIKGIELPPSTSNAIYQRMRADMEKIARGHRARGQAKAEAIRAEADAEVTIITSEAVKKAKEIRAKADAKAATIYANAYRKDEDFYRFYRSLQAYRNSFNSKNDILVLDQSSSFFDYFKHSLPNSNGNAKKN